MNAMKAPCRRAVGAILLSIASGGALWAQPGSTGTQCRIQSWGCAPLDALRQAIPKDAGSELSLTHLQLDGGRSRGAAYRLILMRGQEEATLYKLALSRGAAASWKAEVVGSRKLSRPEFRAARDAAFTSLISEDPRKGSLTNDSVSVYVCADGIAELAELDIGPPSALVISRSKECADDIALASIRSTLEGMLKK